MVSSKNTRAVRCLQMPELKSLSRCRVGGKEEGGSAAQQKSLENSSGKKLRRNVVGE
jgi:hypothetical protein